MEKLRHYIKTEKGYLCFKKNKKEFEKIKKLDILNDMFFSKKTNQRKEFEREELSEILVILEELRKDQYDYGTLIIGSFLKFEKEEKEIERKFKIDYTKFEKWIEGIPINKNFNKIQQYYTKMEPTEERYRETIHYSDEVVIAYKGSIKANNGMILKCSQNKNNSFVYIPITYVKTIKSKGSMVRTEKQMNIPSFCFFEKIRTNKIGNVIKKSRENYTIEKSNKFSVDSYYINNAYCIMEKEFENIKKANAFEIKNYDFIIEEVTHDKRYKNGQIALDGFPN